MDVAIRKSDGNARADHESNCNDTATRASNRNDAAIPESNRDDARRLTKAIAWMP